MHSLRAVLSAIEDSITINIVKCYNRKVSSERDFSNLYVYGSKWCEKPGDKRLFACGQNNSNNCKQIKNHFLSQQTLFRASCVYVCVCRRVNVRNFREQSRFECSSTGFNFLFHKLTSSYATTTVAAIQFNKCTNTIEMQATEI